MSRRWGAKLADQVSSQEQHKEVMSQAEFRSSGQLLPTGEVSADQSQSQNHDKNSYKVVCTRMRMSRENAL